MNSKILQVQLLIVEDSSADAELLLAELEHRGYAVEHHRVETKADFLAALQNRSWDAVVSDYVLPQFSGPEALKLVREQGSDVPFIVVSGVHGETEAVEMMRAGANDYIMKGNLSRLAPALEREIDAAQARRLHQRALGAMQYLAAIVESSEDAIYGKNLNSLIVSWNPAAERMFGYSAEEIVGKSVVVLFPKYRRDELLDTLGAVRRGDTVALRETERLHKSGRLIPMSITVSPIRNAAGEIIGASSIARDLSGQKQVEFEKQELLEQLSAARARFRTAEAPGGQIEAPSPGAPADAPPRFTGATFPKLKENQFAGLCSEGWTIFDALGPAREYASQWLAKQPADEYQIYNAHRRLIYTVVSGRTRDDLQSASKAAPPKPWWRFWE